MTTQMFGERIQRNEDPRLLTGKGRFVDDFGHDAYAAAFLRSDFGHAKILDIDISEAIAMEGVYGVYTHADLEGVLSEPLPLLIPNDKLIEPRTQYALAKEEVCFVGEVVAMVVACDRYVAEDAVGMIFVDYEPLPVASDL